MHSGCTVAYISITVCLLNRHAATNAANSLNADVTISKIAACCTTSIGLMLFFMLHLRTLCDCIVGDVVARLLASSHDQVVKAARWLCMPAGLCSAAGRGVRPQLELWQPHT